ncbi:Membrane protein [Mycena venus]|uniref:Membrane protein n=1 Tax=Mycena venus TaxID=2733690 RepID=A0A8H6YBT1_9AGAR|nr:Membrane protein [Mycena venus]
MTRPLSSGQLDLLLCLPTASFKNPIKRFSHAVASESALATQRICLWLCGVAALANKHVVIPGHYRTLEWSEKDQVYAEDPNPSIWMEVDEMKNSHSVVKTKGPSDGWFTYTSHEAGDHSIGLSTDCTLSFLSTHIRLYVLDVNQKLEDINREQQYQRQRVADFRNLSVATNLRAVWYNLAQIIALVVTCTWQLRHLKRFFEEREMR